MLIQTNKVVALAALIVATGVAAVELARHPAQADPMLVSAGYAGARIEGAFALVAQMPALPALALPVAKKGDLPLPLGCLAESGANAQAECMDVAYEPGSSPSIVVETRAGATTTLTRMDALTVADIEDEEQPQSE